MKTLFRYGVRLEWKPKLDAPAVNTVRFPGTLVPIWPRRWLPVVAAVAAAVLAWSGPVQAHATPVALTFDDLPMLGLPTSAADAGHVTDKLLAGLIRHHLPATGFVNESKLEGDERPQRIALLKHWLDAGMDLGNHSYSHLSLTSTPVDAYIANVARGETVIRALLAARGRVPRWYRHPYLETGPTLEIRRQFESWLADHGYRVAPVSMENSDWMFALPYDDAVRRGDASQAAHVRQAYLDYTALVVPWYRQAAIGLLGREPAFVFLLHATRLNSDSIDALAHILRANHLHGVTLDRALADPAYAIADTYAGPDGIGWLERWSLTMGATLPWATLPPLPADISAASALLDAPPVPAPPAVPPVPAPLPATVTGGPTR